METLYERLPVIDEEQLTNAPAEITEELFGLLAKQLPSMQIAINQAFAAKQVDVLHGLLHKLQGSCVYCGLMRLKSCAADTMESLKLQNGELDDLLVHLNKEIDAVNAELKKRGFN
jgi:HPt (histidine-containing phosphotransfer) domain-containing protein